MEFASILSAVGTAFSVLGSFNQANEMRAAAEANAENMRRIAAANKMQADAAANDAAAASQLAAIKERRKAMLTLSRAQALAAASGGGALDETLANGLIEEGEKDFQYRLYEGSEREKGLRYQGDVGVYEANSRGRSEVKAANKAADATILGALGKGAMSFASFAPGDAPTAASGADAYNGTWTSEGSFDARTYTKRIWD